MEVICKMILPDGCEEIIKLQRSNYGKKNIKKAYHEDIEKEFNGMYSYLPEKCNGILDIGCGLGGMSVLLYHRYEKPNRFAGD